MLDLLALANKVGWSGILELISNQFELQLGA